jgi:hypothetical protein
MPTQKELSDLREAYLLRREAALENKVSRLGIKLYDKVFERYLIALQQQDGKLIYSQVNLNLIQGLDRVYALFNQVDNLPVIDGFFKDLNGITPLNEKYFKNIQKSGVRAEAEVVTSVVQKKLGLQGGQPVAGGFADKFINDKTLLKKIKKQTTQAITKGQSFQEFRQTLKKTIQGTSEVKGSGGLQQYYRNYAYDTYQKVDRLNQDLFAKELGLRYFIWAGGLVSNSRPLCRLANGKIIDKTTYSKLKYSDLKISLREGVGPEWNPMNDLGHYGCRHTKNYITDSVARQLEGRWLKTSAFT